VLEEGFDHVTRFPDDVLIGGKPVVELVNFAAVKRPTVDYEALVVQPFHGSSPGLLLYERK
jgi:hypothetical protein